MLVNLNPVLVKLGPFTIRWYGAMMALSLGIGYYFLLIGGRKRGLNEDFLSSVSLLAIIGGILGARAIYVLTNIDYFAQFPSEIVRIDHGGLSFHGSLLGGMLASLWYIRRNGMTFGAIADLTVPGLAIGYSLVRVANIFNQEVLGRPTALYSFGRHPTQIYGVIIGLALFAINNIQKKKVQPLGYLFWSFFLYYSVLRGLIEETFRQNPLFIWGYVNEYYGVGLFTLTQVLTPFLILLSVIMIFRTHSTT